MENILENFTSLHLGVNRNLNCLTKCYFSQTQYETAFCLLKSELFVAAGPALPSVVAYPKRSQTSTADSDLKEDGIPSRKSSGAAAGGKGIAPASPMLGNASNPNKADIPERKKSPAVPSVSTVG